MIQKEFAKKVSKILEKNDLVLGLAAGGSWITNEIDEFSDLDLVIVTSEKIGGDFVKMKSIAESIGELLSCFLGDHVGEPRLLICLYKNPLLHVDLKFVTIQEFAVRIENPVILYDSKNLLKEVINSTVYKFPQVDFQWIEDRFWIWIHYGLLKVNRGELMEAFDFLGFLRITVFGPLLHLKNQNLPRGVRKVEKNLPLHDLESLIKTIGKYEKDAILNSFESAVNLYRDLRNELFDKNEITFQDETEQMVLDYLQKNKN